MRASILFIAYLALFHLWAICFGGLFFPFDCFLLMFLIHTSLNIDGCLLFNCVCVCMCTLSHFSRIQLFATLWTAAHQASLSIRFSRQEYWSGFPCPPLEDLPDPGNEPVSPALQADSLLLSNGGSPSNHYIYSKKKLQKWYIHALQILYIGLLSKHWD